MVIGFIEPTYEVLKDYYVTQEEVLWFGQEITTVVISSVMMTILMATFTLFITKLVVEA